MGTVVVISVLIITVNEMNDTGGVGKPEELAREAAVLYWTWTPRTCSRGCSVVSRLSASLQEALLCTYVDFMCDSSIFPAGLVPQLPVRVHNAHPVFWP